MWAHCQIHVEKPPGGPFKPGDVITGYIDYPLQKNAEFNNVILSLKGRSKCYWKDKKKTNNGDKTKFNGEEDLVSINLNMLNDGDDEIKAGLHSFPFSFTLPNNIPPSFKDDGDNYHASIEYIIRAKFIFSRKLFPVFSFPLRFYENVTVVNPIVLTKPLESVTYGLHDELSKKFGAVVDTNQDFDLKVTLAKSVITPGENLDLYLQVYNNTKHSVGKIYINLFQNLTLTDDSRNTNIISKEIKDSRMKTKKIGKEQYTRSFHTITIPNYLSTVQNSRIIGRDYKLVIKTSISNMKREINLDIPLLIGWVIPPKQNINVEATQEQASNVATLNNDDDDDEILQEILTKSLCIDQAFELNIGSPASSSNSNDNATPSSSTARVTESPPDYWQVVNEKKEPLD